MCGCGLFLPVKEDSNTPKVWFQDRNTPQVLSRSVYLCHY
jgi:hypothetical protein